MNFAKELEFLKAFDLEDFEKKVRIYKDLLKSFNAVHNLTRFKNIDENIIDSLKILDFKDLSFAKNIVDVGSGAGFPAVFLALILKANFYLFEPNAKKATFLRMVKIECKLSNLHIFKEKIEECKACFKAELITSRAFSNASFLIKLCQNFTDKNTLFLLYKGSKAKEELKNFKDYEIFKRGFRRYCLIKASSFSVPKLDFI